MIAVLQRVSSGEVKINGNVSGAIQKGLVILLGVMKNDTKEDVIYLIDKIAGFRIFNDKNGKMNLSIKDVNGSALVISQFTLCGDWKKGRRPSFVRAASSETGKYFYEEFIKELAQKGIPIETGEFGATMSVSLVNEGPVTFVFDSK
tara:strand:- start:467 stop:907 length:441 start_codon:yes stop_codon:yes gene_type:complete